jgi:hypothetical protein
MAHLWALAFSQGSSRRFTLQGAKGLGGQLNASPEDKTGKVWGIGG